MRLVQMKSSGLTTLQAGNGVVEKESDKAKRQMPS